MKSKIYTILVMLFLFISGCSQQTISTPAAETPSFTAPSTSPTDPSTPTFEISPSPTPLAASGGLEIPLPQYTLNVNFNYDEHTLQVDEAIRYYNASTETINDLVLMVDPLYFPGVFTLKELKWGNGQPVNNIQTDRGWLRFDLQTPLALADRIDLLITYQLDLPSPQPSPTTRPVPFGYTAQQTNLVDWYPFIPPYIPGQGWIAHPASYYGEHLSYDLSDFDVTIQLSPARDNLIIAASSPGQQEDTKFHYEHLKARNFAWSASPYYQVLEAQAGPITVRSYAFAGQQAANQRVLDTTVQSLELFSRLFGEYPRMLLSVVEADFLDGMEYDGLYFLSKGFYNLYTDTPGQYLVTIAAHETAHQWWYASLANDQAMEPWLDEALCTFSELLYYENVAPAGVDWWWNARVKFYNPRGWVDTTIYNPFGDAQPYRGYRDAVYLNGAVFLDALRTHMGSQSFMEFLKAYATQNQWGRVTRDNFFELLNQYSTNDPSEIINLYFYLP